MLDVSLAHAVDVGVAEVKLHQPAVHRADPLQVDLARLYIHGGRLEGIRGLEGVDGEEERLGSLQAPELSDAGPECAGGGLAGTSERREQLAVDARGRVGGPGDHPRAANVRKARSVEYRVVADIEGGDAAGSHDLGHYGLVVVERIEP